MRQRIAAALLAIASVTVATPATARLVLFQGVLGVRAASSACGILPYVEQGNLYRAAYRPANVGTNGASTSLIIIPMDMNIIGILISTFKLTNASLNGTFQLVDVDQMTSNRRLSLNFEKYKTLMRMAQQTPGDTDGADFLTLTLQIRRFGNVAGCTVTLRGILTDKSTPLL